MAKGVCSVCGKKRPHRKDVDGWTAWVASKGRGKDYVQQSFVACPEHEDEARKALHDFLGEDRSVKGHTGMDPAGSVAP